MSDNPYESPRERPAAADVEDKPPPQRPHWCATWSLLLALFGYMSCGLVIVFSNVPVFVDGMILIGLLSILFYLASLVFGV